MEDGNYNQDCGSGLLEPYILIASWLLTWHLGLNCRSLMLNSINITVSFLGGNTKQVLKIVHKYTMGCQAVEITRNCHKVKKKVHMRFKMLSAKNVKLC